MRCRAPELRFPKSRPIALSAQLVDAGAPENRYDLVLDWLAPPRVRAIVELKVDADLTWVDGRDQVDHYLSTVARDDEREGWVFLLAPTRLDLVDRVACHAQFGGQVPAQRLHDRLRALVRDRNLSERGRWIAREVAHVMEEVGMAAPTMTFDGITSAFGFLHFREALKKALDGVRDEALADGGALANWSRRRNPWDDDAANERMGYRVYVKPDDTTCFAYLGIAIDEHVSHEGVPDLMIFLEAKPGTPAHQRFQAGLDRHAAEASLTTACGKVRWQVGDADDWQVAMARVSLVNVLAESDGADAVRTQLLDALRALESTELLARFYDATTAAK